MGVLCTPVPTARRGTVTIGLLLAFSLLMLAAVGVVGGGAHEHGLTARRAETMRAFYAAEAGMNMALREVFTNTDEDGDGTVGAISDDGDETNDPALPGARVAVSGSVSGATTTLRSTGRSGESRRSVIVTAE
ncbi:MAG: hypothetical protein ACK4WH_03480 [Phycisphaerales bacterium]